TNVWLIVILLFTCSKAHHHKGHVVGYLIYNRVVICQGSLFLSVWQLCFDMYCNYLRIKKHILCISYKALHLEIFFLHNEYVNDDLILHIDNKLCSFMHLRRYPLFQSIQRMNIMYFLKDYSCVTGVDPELQHRRVQIFLSNQQMISLIIFLSFRVEVAFLFFIIRSCCQFFQLFFFPIKITQNQLKISVSLLLFTGLQHANMDMPNAS
ncbi:hypothetical protein ACJX0J_031025, partial [Zea mays]